RIGRIMLDGWCIAQMLIAVVPFMIGIRVKNRALLLPHMALDVLLILLLFVIWYARAYPTTESHNAMLFSVTNACFALLLSMVVDGAEWKIFGHSLMLSSGVLITLAFYSSLFTNMLR